MDDRVVGVLGGGQLGRMLVEAAHRLNVKVIILDAPGSSAKQINAVQKHVDGSFSNADDVQAISKQCDVLTVEIEHVNTNILEEISKISPKPAIYPSWQTIRTIQDKFTQKEFLLRHGISTAESIPIDTPTLPGLIAVGNELGYPYMLKSRTEAYDGRGNFPVKSELDIAAALDALKNRPLYAEKWANFKMELAAMVVHTSDKAIPSDWKDCTLSFPVVETVHEDSICKLVFAPARGVSSQILQKAQELARMAVACFAGKGVFAVEMFLLDDDSLLVNEIAPRPHNSGHYTIEACHMSQYEAHLRAILDIDIPTGSTDFATDDTNSIMLNILGGSEKDSHIKVGKEALKVSGAKIHLYGKGDARPGRKMGHITIVGSSMDEAETKIQPLIDCVDTIRAERLGLKTVLSQAVSKVTAMGSKPNSSSSPLIAVTMGSDSDLNVLKPGLAILDELEIAYEVTITSAHRTPVRMLEFAQSAASRGLKVIIAAAGGAAHLPGMVAAATPLPVIGVPVKGSTFDGMDSLLSIVQMPRGVPVATVAINNSTNAALLAARIIGSSDKAVQHRIEKYQKDMETTVLGKAEKLETGGWKSYTT